MAVPKPRHRNGSVQGKIEHMKAIQKVTPSVHSYIILYMTFFFRICHVVTWKQQTCSKNVIGMELLVYSPLSCLYSAIRTLKFVVFGTAIPTLLYIMENVFLYLFVHFFSE